jgi:DNA-binding LytR/AlgR family response regulator
MGEKELLRCIVIDDDAVARSVIEHFIDDTNGLELTGTYESAVEAIDHATKSLTDLVFLDVEMPQMSGIEMLETLSDPPMVVLVTGKADYAVEAFEVDAADYLLKPVTYARFLKAIMRVRNARQGNRETRTDETHVFVKSEGKLMKVALAEIEWIEAQRDYVLINTENQRYFIHSTMKRLESRLATERFQRVHRSYIVRLDKISDIQDASIIIGRKVVPIGASYKSDLLDRINLL